VPRQPSDRLNRNCQPVCHERATRARPSIGRRKKGMKDNLRLWERNWGEAQNNNGKKRGGKKPSDIKGVDEKRQNWAWTRLESAPSAKIKAAWHSKKGKGGTMARMTRWGARRVRKGHDELGKRRY